MSEQRHSHSVGQPLRHDSAALQATGEALYVDDLPALPGELQLYALLSPHAHAHIRAIDSRPALQVPGVVLALTAADVPGRLDIGAILPGDPLLAAGMVQYAGQPVALIAADTLEAARHGAQAVQVEYEVLEPVLDIDTAMQRQHFVAPPQTLQRGDAPATIAAAPHQLSGRLRSGGQEHLYLETQVALVQPGEDRSLLVFSATQNPTEVQKKVASVLGLAMHQVVVETRRLGGGFGGKETQAAQPACLAALAAWHSQRPARMRLPRHADILMTGKRHPFQSDWRVGFDDDGHILGIEMDLAADCGFSPDLSPAIVDRALFHADNAYYLPAVRLTGWCCRTNHASNTAFRGFGGPQGMLVIEEVIEQIARTLGLDPLLVRQRNYYGAAPRDLTPYFQSVEHNLLDEMTSQLAADCEYPARRAAISAFNASNPLLKKGLALTPVKFGISFTSGLLNQGGALLSLYTDGSILLNHGGTEMGQGLHIKVAQVVAEELGVDVRRIRISATRTDKVPNTPATAASSGADLNGQAARQAAQILRQRLVQMLASHYAVPASEVVFVDDRVQVGEQSLSFADCMQLAWEQRVPLSSTGFYRTPKIHYDREQGRGHPFFYYAFGVACSEVVIDTLTGEYRVLRVDILHDVGSSLNPAIDRGQVEGGFIQGLGWLTCEELVWDASGHLLTASPATYKIPTIGELPEVFNVQLLQNRRNPEDTVFHSKAVGEPPLMLAISAWCAIKDAIASLTDYHHPAELDAPATPERVLWAIERMRQRQTRENDHD